MAYKFQDRILRKIAHRRWASIILPMGAGKTRITCLWANGKPAGPRLVLCPSAGLDVWEREIGKWLPGQPVTTIIGSRHHKIYTLTRMTAGIHWYIITYESFRSIANHLLGATLPSLAILDESHAIQSPKAKVTRAVHTWLTPVRFKAILTGTPFGNSELNIWTQIYFLDRGIALGKSFYQFRYNHFEPDDMGWKWTLKPRSRKLINEVLQQYGVVMDEKEIDLPPRTYSIVTVEQTPWQQKLLTSLKDEFAVYFKDGTTAYETKWVVAQISKMRQVCSGFMKIKTNVAGGTTDAWWDGTSLKYKHLAELLDNELAGHKVVIWCVFRHEIKRISEMLNQKAIGHVIYQGDTSYADRKANVEAFQQQKSIRCFVGQVATGGQAITLTEADRVVYFSNSYSVRSRLQSEKRTHRIGSEKHKRIHYTDLLTSGSVEVLIHEMLMMKQLRNEAIVLRHLIQKMIKG